MPVTDPASVASPSEGHRVAARDRNDEQPGETEPRKSEGHPKGAKRQPLPSLDGPDALADFIRAPRVTQAAFWSAIAERAAWEHRLSAYRSTLADPDAPAPIAARRLPGSRPLTWDERWRRRAARDRRYGNRRAEFDGDFAAQKNRLASIPAAEYVERLVGEEPNHGGYLRCPLPGHDERTASFRCLETTWWCWGCGERGSIYDLAGILWGLEREGRDFITIHKRLLEVFR